MSLQMNGITDSITTCDCCGRSNLKRTVACVNTETGAELFFGTSCAAQVLGISSDLAGAKAQSSTRALRWAVYDYNTTMRKFAGIPVLLLADSAIGEVRVDKIENGAVHCRHMVHGRRIIPLSSVSLWKPRARSTGTVFPVSL